MRRMIGSRAPEGRGVRDLLPFGRIEIFALLWIACILGTLAASSSHEQHPLYIQGRYGKRDESYPLKRISEAEETGFFVGRYGRSDSARSHGSRTNSKPLEIVPRFDRFFVGSRYGKRGFPEENSVRRLHQRQAPGKYSSLKRYEDAFGYFDRVERSDPLSRTIDSRERRRDDDVEYEPDNEDAAVEISTEDDLDNFW